MSIHVKLFRGRRSLSNSDSGAGVKDAVEHGRPIAGDWLALSLAARSVAVASASQLFSAQTGQDKVPNLSELSLTNIGKIQGKLKSASRQCQVVLFHDRTVMTLRATNARFCNRPT